MKRVYVGIISLLLCTYLSAENSHCYKIDRTSDTVTVYFDQDCKDTLWLYEIINDSKVDLFFDGRNKSRKNEEEFRNVYTSSKCHVNLYEFSKRHEDKLRICLPLAKLPPDFDEEELYIIKEPKDEEDSTKWVRYILKKNSGVGTETNSLDKIEEQSTVAPNDDNTSKSEQGESKDEPKNASKGIILFLCCWMVLLTLLMIVLVIIVHKQKIESEKILVRVGQIPTQDEVNKWIKKAIGDMSQLPMPSPRLQSVPTPKPQPVPTPKPQPVPMLDTDQVDCNWDSGYFTLQANDKPIFRIYQKGDTRYYTLVESIKSIMPSMLMSTEHFIVVNKRTPEVPKGVEIVKDGIVLRDSNGRLRVDSNNKLTINII